MMTHCSPSYLNRFVSQSLIVGAFATIGLLTGLVPSLSENGRSLSITFDSSASAQAVSSDQVTRFATAALELDVLRIKVQQEIKQLSGGNLVNIDCYQDPQGQGLPSNIRPIAVNFCKDSATIIQNNGFRPTTRFNELKVLHDSNPELQLRVRNEIIRIQKSQGR